MADINVERRSSPGSYTWIWMLVAVLMVGAFMVWLSIASEPSEVAVVSEEDGNGDDADDPDAVTVSVGDFAANPDGHTGQRVRLREAQVQARLGEQAFWMELPGGVPYLVRMMPEVVERAVTVNQGDRVDITGQVHEMSDSVIADWEANGVLRTEGERMQAEFATTYLEAHRVRIPGTAGN